MKRLLDIILAIVFLTAGVPWLTLCGIAVKLESRGPLLYRQRRVGLRGKVFWLWKLRTLPQDYELRHGPVLRPVEGVGRLGRYLRRTHLDEFPQFWNVLRGEMSVVGPRPERPEFARLFFGQLSAYWQRELVKPGMTGLAQVEGYDATRMREKLERDLYYVARQSTSLDLWIMLRTAGLCIRRLFHETTT